MKLMIIDQCKKYDLKMSNVIRIICNEYFHKITNDKNIIYTGLTEITIDITNFSLKSS